MKSFLGYLVIIIICLITLALWLLSKPDYSLVSKDVYLSLSQALSLLAITLIPLTLVITTRMKFVEFLFGSLDKAYQAHRIIGGMAFIFILNHPILLAAKSSLNPQISLIYLTPGNNFSYNAGIASLYLLIIVSVFLVFIKLPYHIWKWTHRILGLSFMLGILHIFTIGSDIASSYVLKYWIIFLVTLGMSSLFYTLFLYKKIGPKYRYVVDRTERHLSYINIWLKPAGKKLKFHPGQFIFVKFLSSELGYEIHPFTISSADSEPNLRLSVKIVGDYTIKLPLLRSGEKAEVFGPYGKFGISDHRNIYKQFWIAGGIGITPFLSMLREGYLNGHSDREINICYLYRDPTDAVYADEIKTLIMGKENIRFLEWSSKEKGRFKADLIKNILGDFNRLNIFLCGPNNMMEHLKEQFVNLGIPEDRVIFEKFQLV